MDENGSRPSMARPLLCGIMMALVVLAIGLAAWTLVGIDRRSQQLARYDDAMVGQCPDDSVVTHGDGQLVIAGVWDSSTSLYFIPDSYISP